MRHGGDHQHRRQVDGEEPAAEQQRIGALVGDDVQPPRQHQQRADADEGEHVEGAPLVAQRATHHRDRAPQHGERRTDEQARRRA